MSEEVVLLFKNPWHTYIHTHIHMYMDTYTIHAYHSNITHSMDSDVLRVPCHNHLPNVCMSSEHNADPSI